MQILPPGSKENSTLQPRREIVFHFIWILLVAIVTVAEGGGGVGGGTPPTYSTKLEETLRTSLWDGYSILQRPKEKVSVNISLSVMTINKMDIKHQVMSLTGFLTVEWKDDRLQWNDNSSYASIRFLYTSEEYTWRPSLVIQNSVDDVSIISDKNVPMRIQNDGYITWNPLGIYKISCEADTSYYPMDIQTCTLTITSWAYTNKEISILFSEPPIDFTYFSENGEWEFIKSSTAKPESSKRGGQSFDELDFVITIRRRPMFHVLNTLFPVVLMAVLSATVFKLPVESGEKIGFALTVLLAYAVYLTLISENIPSTSVTVCFLSVYLAMIFCLGTISVLCTIIVINVYFRSDEDEPMTDFHKRLFVVLARITCHTTYSCCSRLKSTKIMPIDGKTEPAQEEIDNAVSKKNLEIDQKNIPSTPSSPDGQSTFTNISSVEETRRSSAVWKDLAVMLDRFFFFVFMFATLVSATVFCGIIIAKWFSVAVSS